MTRKRGVAAVAPEEKWGRQEGDLRESLGRDGGVGGEINQSNATRPSEEKAPIWAV